MSVGYHRFKSSKVQAVKVERSTVQISSKHKSSYFLNSSLMRLHILVESTIFLVGIKYHNWIEKFRLYFIKDYRKHKIH